MPQDGRTRFSPTPKDLLTAGVGAHAEREWINVPIDLANRL